MEERRGSQGGRVEDDLGELVLALQGVLELGDILQLVDTFRCLIDLKKLLDWVPDSEEDESLIHQLVNVLIHRGPASIEDGGVVVFLILKKKRWVTVWLLVVIKIRLLT